MSRAVFPRLPAPRVTHGVTLALVLLALSACTAGPLGGPLGGTGDAAVGPSGTAGEGPTDLATQQACRQRVNEMYEIRNRSDIYAANPAENTPSSANSYVGVPSHGLSGQFAYSQSIAECERNARSGATTPSSPTQGR